MTAVEAMTAGGMAVEGMAGGEETFTCSPISCSRLVTWATSSAFRCDRTPVLAMTP